jgi:choline dehydrogenase-like flavoprotein
MVDVIECGSIVIGSGAGGGVAAEALALAGERPVVLEEGPRFEVEDIARLSSSEALQTLYRRAGLQPVFGTPKVVYGEGRCVGGSTVVNGGLLWFPSDWRTQRWEESSGPFLPSHQTLTKHARTIASNLSMRVQGDEGGNLDSSMMRAGALELGLRWQHPQRVVTNCKHANRCTMGCTTGAKHAVLDTYLTNAERLGALVVANARATKLVTKNRRVIEVQARVNGRHTAYKPSRVILAAGAIGSPELLLRSGIWPERDRPKMSWHANIRFIARFNDEVFAEDGTIFTTQINEYEKQGIYLMPANSSPGMLAGFLQVHGAKAVQEYLAAPEKYAVFTAQVEMQGKISISTMPTLGRLMNHVLTSGDEVALRFASERMTSVLFASGAERIYPPVNGHGALTKEHEATVFAETNPIDGWQLLSVHGMASCPMGDPHRGGVVDGLGRIPTVDNLHIVDASVLPGASGISPQGSIMAFAHTIMGDVLE